MSRLQERAFLCGCVVVLAVAAPAFVLELSRGVRGPYGDAITAELGSARESVAEVEPETADETR